jgi:ribosomal protein L11 methyltransferase
MTDYQPFEISTRFRILPPDAPPSGDDRIDLVMQRGAFGSGEHETTQSCLELLAGLPEITDARVLDLGSGTGILAIAALKLGAQHALCVDIDPDAVRSAQVNVRLNGLESRVGHCCGTLDDVTATDFDLVLANIYGDILLPLAPQLSDKVRAEGTLLLSGILWEYNFDVRRTYTRHGCRIERNRMLPEFSSILLRRE